MHPVLFHIGSILIPSYGATAALGVLLALALAQRTARMVELDPGKVWNLCILSLFAALAAARLLLVVVNWSVLRHHPAWLLAWPWCIIRCWPRRARWPAPDALLWYARRSKLPLAATADALAAPLALGLAFEQLGALLPAPATALKPDPAALGRHLHQSAGRHLERRAARRSAASCAGLCRAGFSRAGRFCCCWCGCRLSAAKATWPDWD